MKKTFEQYMEEITKEQWENNYEGYRDEFYKTFDKDKYAQVKPSLEKLFTNINGGQLPNDELVFISPLSLNLSLKDLQTEDDKIFYNLLKKYKICDFGKSGFLNYLRNIYLKNGEKANLKSFFSSKFSSGYIAKCLYAGIARAYKKGGHDAVEKMIYFSNMSGSIFSIFKDNVAVGYVDANFFKHSRTPIILKDYYQEILNKTENIPQNHIDFIWNLMDDDKDTEDFLVYKRMTAERGDTKYTISLEIKKLSFYTMGTEYLIGFSYDHRWVASQSTLQGWRSCMNFDKSINTTDNYTYVGSGASAGCFIAYLFDKNSVGKEDARPTGRVLFKPFYPASIEDEGKIPNFKNILWVPDVEYGELPSWFIPIAAKIVNKAQKYNSKVGIFKIPEDDVYNDKLPNYISVGTKKINYYFKKIQISPKTFFKLPQNIQMGIIGFKPEILSISEIINYIVQEKPALLISAHSILSKIGNNNKIIGDLYNAFIILPIEKQINMFYPDGSKTTVSYVLNAFKLLHRYIVGDLGREVVQLSVTYHIPLCDIFKYYYQQISDETYKIISLYNPLEMSKMYFKYATTPECFVNPEIIKNVFEKGENELNKYNKYSIEKISYSILDGLANYLLSPIYQYDKLPFAFYKMFIPYFKKCIHGNEINDSYGIIRTLTKAIATRTKDTFETFSNLISREYNFNNQEISAIMNYVIVQGDIEVRLWAKEYIDKNENYFREGTKIELMDRNTQTKYIKTNLREKIVSLASSGPTLDVVKYIIDEHLLFNKNPNLRNDLVSDLSDEENEVFEKIFSYILLNCQLNSKASEGFGIMHEEYSKIINNIFTRWHLAYKEFFPWVEIASNFTYLQKNYGSYRSLLNPFQELIYAYYLSPALQIVENQAKSLPATWITQNVKKAIIDGKGERDWLLVLYSFGSSRFLITMKEYYYNIREYITYTKQINEPIEVAQERLADKFKRPYEFEYIAQQKYSEWLKKSRANINKELLKCQ